MQKIFSYIAVVALTLQIFGMPPYVISKPDSAHAAARINYLGVAGKTYIGSTPPNPPNLQSGLVGHWTFDGADMKPNVRDRSGQGNHGTLSGFTATTTVPGRHGQALNLDGSNDYVSTVNIDALESGDMSLCIWVNPASLGTQWLLQQWDPTSSGMGPALWTEGSAGNRIHFEIGTYPNSLAATRALTLNVWQHVCATASGNLLSIYYNGALDNSGSKTRVESSASELFTIGGPSESGVNFFSGKMDDARVYNRALSASEIAQIYKIGNPLREQSTFTPPNLQSGLVGHWTFDGPDMTSTNAIDRSGQGNNGGLAGGLSKIPGRLGQALQFNGSDTYINVSASTSINNWSAQSIAFWFRTSGTGMSQYARLIEKGANNEWTVYWDTAIVVPTLGAASPPIVTSPGGLGDNMWHHAAVTISSDATASVKLYIDGVLRDSDTSAQPAGKTNGISIGRYSGTGYNFNGSMDDVRVYNRELSATEVLQLYNLGR